MTPPRRAPEADEPEPASGATGAGRPPLGWKHVGLAAASGALATVALFLAPWFGAVPLLMYPPYVPIDLRLVLPTALFALAHVAGHYTRWPAPAMALPGIALAMATAAHLHASAALGFAGLAWAAPGTRVNVVALGTSLASLLIGLQVALQVAGDRFQAELAHRGLDAQAQELAKGAAGRVTDKALATAAVAAAVLGLALRIVDQISGDARLPLPEVIALVLVLALGGVLLEVGSFRWPGAPDDEL